MNTARQRVADSFAHRQPDRAALWSIIRNRPVYEHVLGADRVGDAGEVPLDEKLALHAEVYRALGIDITRAHLWPRRSRTASNMPMVRSKTSIGRCMYWL
jgi:hypothetical protein